MLVHRESIVAKAPGATAIIVALPLLVTGYRAWIGEGWEQILFGSVFAILIFVVLAALYFRIAKRGR
ncbi:hypothetical protein AAG596_12965 [Citromicrobium bathyomarinum]|uniref:hypothetical protein n=1 Tax=Citromicrobium bathyomarinum TaxID=72174 RepID=UPI003159CBDF